MNSLKIKIKINKNKTVCSAAHQHFKRVRYVSSFPLPLNKAERSLDGGGGGSQIAELEKVEQWLLKSRGAREEAQWEVMKT